MSKRRVTVFDNREPEEAKILNISAGISLAEFLKQSAAKLGTFTAQAPPKKAFLQDGGVLDDADIIRDNDVIYISAGEAFYRTQQGNGNNGAAAAVGGAGGDKKADQAVTYSIAVMGPGSVGKVRRRNRQTTTEPPVLCRTLLSCAPQRAYVSVCV
jgi:hypothetical protein